MGTKLTWTPERDETLFKMIRLGYTYSEIGDRLDIGRNAIAGRCHRLGLKQAKSECLRPKSPPKPLPKMPVLRVVVMTAGPFKLVDIPRRGCHWPVAEDGDGLHLFCGADTGDLAKSYCGDHHKVSYSPRRSG